MKFLIFYRVLLLPETHRCLIRQGCVSSDTSAPPALSCSSLLLLAFPCSSLLFPAPSSYACIPASYQYKKQNFIPNSQKLYALIPASSTHPRISFLPSHYLLFSIQPLLLGLTTDRTSLFLYTTHFRAINHLVAPRRRRSSWN